MIPTRVLVTLVLLSLGLTGCARHRPPKGGDLSWVEPGRMADWTRTWDKSGYNPCDTRVLGHYWRLRPADARARAGMKLETVGIKVFEDLYLAPAREAALQTGGVQCSYADGGFTEADIQLLAGFWGTSFEDAAQTVAGKLLWGGGWMAWDAVKTASKSKGYTEGPGEDDGTAQALDAFWNSGLHYCDARMLATAWGMDPFDAKITLGNKVKWFRDDPAYVAQVVNEAHTHALAQGAPPCEWVETSYSYNDAEALACAWGMSVDQAKVTIASKVTQGMDAQIREALAGASCP